MSTDITNEEDQVELTEKDLDVIEEINQENEPEDTSSDVEETSDVAEEVDAPQAAQDPEPDDDPGYDDNLVQWANYYGIKPDDYSNEDALRRHVASTGQYYQQIQQQQQLQQQQYVPEQNTQTEATAPREFRVDLDEDYDPGLIEGVNGLANQMSSHYDEQFNVLAQELLDQKSFIDSQRQELQAAQHQRELEEFDGAVGGLGSQALFGEGAYAGLTQGSTEARNREFVYDQVLVLANGYQAQGKQIPGMNDLVGQAYRTIFSNEIDNQNRKSFNDRVRKQAKRRMGSGSTSKKTSVPTDDPVDNPLLKEAFDGFLKENGDI